MISYCRESVRTNHCTNHFTEWRFSDAALLFPKIAPEVHVQCPDQTKSLGSTQAQESTQPQESCPRDLILHFFQCQGSFRSLLDFCDFWSSMFSVTDPDAAVCSFDVVIGILTRRELGWYRGICLSRELLQSALRAAVYTWFAVSALPFPRILCCLQISLM